MLLYFTLLTAEFATNITCGLFFSKTEDDHRPLRSLGVSVLLIACMAGLGSFDSDAGQGRRHQANTTITAFFIHNKTPVVADLLTELLYSDDNYATGSTTTAIC